MSSRPRRGSIAANPVLIGAATVLVLVVGVFLAYNANNGLPFVPTYQIDAEVPDASGLIRGNDVRQGGALVGRLTKITPLTRADGTVGAVLHLKLDGNRPRLPVDSVLRIRPRSPLGLKYVELTAGRSARTLPGGSTLPLSAATSPPVEIDDVFNMFDRPTRDASAEQLDEFGTGVAGRGDDLNAALGRLRPLTVHADRALRTINAPRTRFGSLFPALERSAREVAPVADRQATLFTGLATTFTAFASVSRELQDTISLGPAALDTATRELPAQASFVRASTRLFAQLRPAFGNVAAAAPGLASAFRAGTPALRRSPALNRRLVGTLAALERFAADARVSPALDRLRETSDLLAPTIAFATPAQTTCNYLGLFFHNLASALSESDVVGSFLSFSVLAQPQLTPDSEAGPAARPADGPATADPSQINDSYLHSNPYPNTAAPGQTHECEAGNEGYRSGRQVIGNVPGDQGTGTEATGDFSAGAK